MRKTLTGVLIGTVLLMLLLLGCAGLLLGTEAGLQFAWPHLVRLAGPALSVESVSGRLSGPLHLQGVGYRTDRDLVRAGELRLDWDPLALAGGTLRIREVFARDVQYRKLGGTTTESPPLVLPEHIRPPLAIELQDLRLEAVSLATGADAQPVSVERLRLSAAMRDTGLRIGRIELQSPELQLQGGAELVMAGDYPLHGTITATLTPPEHAVLEASAELHGTLSGPGLRLALRPPYAANVTVQLRSLFDAPRVDARLELAGSEPAAIRPDWPVMRLDADVRASGSVERLQLQAKATAEGASTGELTATLAGEWQPDHLLLQTLEVTTADGRRRLQVGGRIGLAEAQPVAELQANWQELVWPLTGPLMVGSAHGELDITGAPDAWRLAGNAAIGMPDMPAGSVRLSGHGDRQGFVIESLDAQTLEGRIHGSGRLGWAEQFEVAFDLAAADINPAGLLPDWPGKLELKLQGVAQWPESGWQARLQRASAQGTLRALPLRLEGSGSYRPGSLALQDTRLRSGSSRLVLDGEVGERLSLDWELDSPDLGTLLPGLSGRLAGSGRLLGTRKMPHIITRLDGSGLRYAAERIDALSLEASVDLGGGSESRIDLQHGRGFIAGVVIESLQLQGRGYPQAHRLELAAVGAAGRLDLQLDGDWRDPDWRFRLGEASLVLPGEDSPWRLATPVEGLLGGDHASLPETCWKNAGAMACVQAARERDDLQGRFRLENLPLAMLLQPLQTGLGATGALSGSGEFRRPADRPIQAAGSLTTTGGRLLASEEGGERTLLTFGPGRLRLDAGQDGMQLDAGLPVEGGGLSLQARLQGSDSDWRERGLGGVAKLSLPDLAFAGRLHPEISRLEGVLDGTVTLSGTPASPALLGRLMVSAGEAVLATPGLTLEDIGIEIRGLPSGALLVDASAKSGEGVLSLTGQGGLVAGMPAAELRLQGEDVRVLNTPEARIDASPDLTLALAGERIDLSGEIRVPRARIKPRRLPQSAITVSADQVIVSDQPKLAPRTVYGLHSRVRFVLGDDVRFEGLGLQGRLAGNLLTLAEPGRPATATGELAIQEGSYRAYGQNLDIRTGRLLYAGGPVTGPGLDVEAVRRPAADLLVGVRVRGTLRAPDFTLFSEPDMSQSRQLSWLVLGRDLESNASDAERSAMNEAALMLGLGGGEALGKRLGETLGLDEVRIASEPGATTDQAALLVGKYLSPELFVSYGIGLFEPVSTLRLRYTLTSRWKLVGEASAERSSTDLFYVIERGE